ncbi:PGF-CTERM sorting domain-containing protein [Halosimplex sp. TS25]|uniref:PGF-CTERM sorting domain-containing protein n=1 Tax=Halosimplex rarum TaxID=3396619 RepID=UPI0039EAC04A
MTRDLSRRSLLASGGALFAGSAVAAGVGAADAHESATDPPPLRWSNTYDGATADAVQGALRTADGNYVVVGQSGEGTDSVAPWAFAIDERGRRRWQRRVDTDDVAGFNAVVETDDGGLLLGGYRGQPSQSQEPLFVKLDADREIQWQRTVESPRQGGNVASLVPAGSGRFVAIGLARGDSLPDVSGWIFAVDGAAERQWSRTYGPRHTNFVASVASTTDEGYVVGGGTRAEPTENEQPPFVGWLFEVDDEGNQQWSSTYRESTEETDHRLNFFYDVHATDSGCLAAGGTSRDRLGREQYGWVLSVDGSGERQGQLQTRPAEMDVGQFQGIRPFEGGYALVGVGRPTATDPTSVWAAGIDGELARQWSAVQQFANGSQATTALGTDDDGLVVFGNANVEGGRTATDALALQLGGDPVPTATTGVTTGETTTATATPSPTPSPTATASPSPTATASTTETESVTQAPAVGDGAAGTTADDGHGFGAGVALAALGGSALLRRTRRSHGHGSDEA